MSTTWQVLINEGAVVQEFVIEEIRLTPDDDHPWSAKIVAIVKRQGAAHREVVHFDWSISGREMRALFETVVHQHAYDEAAYRKRTRP